MNTDKKILVVCVNRPAVSLRDTAQLVSIALRGLVSRQLSTDASRLPFIAPAALQLHSHSTTMLIKLRLADTINCGAILRHLLLDATLALKL